MQLRKFVVFEGLDGVGKTSLIRNLYNKHPDTFIPTWEPFDRGLVDYHNEDPEKVAYAFAIDRKIHLDQMLSTFEDDDKVILCDRYVYSNLAYQMYYGVPFDWIMNIQPLNLIWPDVVIHLECDPKIAAERSGETDIERLRVIQNLYKSVYSLRKESPVYVFDTSYIGENEIFDILEGLLNKLELL